MHKTDHTGRRKGRLVAIEPTDKRIEGKVVWRWQCDCGNIYENAYGKMGNTWSCRCLNAELIKNADQKQQLK